MQRSLGQGAVIAACTVVLASIGCGDDDPIPPTIPRPDASTSGSKDAGEKDAGEKGGSATVSYAKDVRPIFANCVICHRKGGTIVPDLTNPFDSEHGLINTPNEWAAQHDSKYETLVKPGDPDASFLIYKVSSDPDPQKFDPTNNGSPMPLQMPRVTAAELADIKKWITDGAKNDSFFTDKVAPIFGTTLTQGSRNGKCVFCHYPGSSTGLNLLDAFSNETGLVGADSVGSTKLRVAPGSPDDSFLVEKIEEAKPSVGDQMPLHYPRLTSGQVDKLRRWIEQGAKDN